MIKGCLSGGIFLFSVLLIGLGSFTGMPVWLIYGVGTLAVLSMLFLIGLNIAGQVKKKRAGKPFFPESSDKMRPLRILQGITLFLVGFSRFRVSVLPEPNHVSNDYLLGISCVLLGILLIFSVQFINPQIAAHGIFDERGGFHPWNEIEKFVWESYARRLIFRLKGTTKLIVFDEIQPEKYPEIYSYLESHLSNPQTAS